MIILDYDVADIIKFMKEEKGKVREIHIMLITQKNIMCHNPCLQNKEYSNLQLKQKNHILRVEIHVQFWGPESVHFTYNFRGAESHTYYKT